MKRIALLNLLNPLTYLWYSVSITATGGGFTQTARVDLLVGGRRIYLGITQK